MRDLPRPLLLAAVLTALEGVFFLGYAVLEVALTATDRLLMAGTTALFFAAYGAGLVACAWGVSGRRAWARSPILLAQLIQLAIAWQFVGDGTTVVAVVLAVLAVVVIGGLLAPASTAALTGGESRQWK